MTEEQKCSEIGPSGEPCEETKPGHRGHWARTADGQQVILWGSLSIDPGKGFDAITFGDDPPRIEVE